MKKPLIIATRRSPLALWQANTFKAILENHGYEVNLNLIVTTGDKMQKGALAQHQISESENVPAHLTTGKGLFVKEIQEEMLANKADIAVHSMKDLPVTNTDGLSVCGILPRAPANDVLILSPHVFSQCGLDISKIKSNVFFETGAIGTTSARRQHFMREHFGSKLNLQILRGNVDSRLKRVKENEFSAIILAEAGLRRLGLFDPSHMISLDTNLFIPAPAQGVVAMECRTDSTELKSLLSQISHKDSLVSAALERTVLQLLGGDCHMAIASHHFQSTLKIMCSNHNLCRTLDFKITENENQEIQKFTSEFADFSYESFYQFIWNSGLTQRLRLSLKDEKFNDVTNEPL